MAGTLSGVRRSRPFYALGQQDSSEGLEDHRSSAGISCGPHMPVLPEATGQGCHIPEFAKKMGTTGVEYLQPGASQRRLWRMGALQMGIHLVSCECGHLIWPHLGHVSS
jgi:hypothetical protein